MNPKTFKKRIAIIGAGPSGLAAIRHALLYDFEPVCFEATNDIGGLWRYKQDNRIINGTYFASVMKNTVINTSKEMTAYSDFVPSADAPNFMHNTELMNYFRSYVEYYGLKEYIRFNHYVLNIERNGDYEVTGEWDVEYIDDDKNEKMETFKGVIVAIGHHATPYYPNPWPEQHKFKGKILHSHDYRDYREFEDKTVVVVGFGNSGGDIAVDLSRISKKVYLSTRRGVWLSYRLDDGGLPFDYKWSLRANQLIKKIVPRSLISKYVERKLMKKFDLELYGIKPNHRFISCHPTQNDEIPTKLANGTILIKKSIKSFTETGIIFEDDTIVDDIDYVILCTGYSINFDLIENGKLIPVNDNKINLYKYMYPPELSTQNTLAIIGCIQPWGSIIPISEMQSRLFYHVLSNFVTLPDEADMIKDIKNKQNELKKRYVNSRRHTIQVDYLQYMDELAKFIGCYPDIFKIGLYDPYLAFKLMFSSSPSYIYRLIGPHKWYGAREALMTADERVKQACNPFNQKMKPKKKHFLSKLLLIFVCFNIIFFIFISNRFSHFFGNRCC